MHVHADSALAERRLAVEAAVELANDLLDGGHQVRETLIDKRYAGAATVGPGEIAEVRRELEPVAAIVRALPDCELEDAVAAVNRLLAQHHVKPFMAEHDGAPLHVHWTAADARFADRVVVDILMALVHTICDEGVERFGHCGAETCEDVFYDPTKNRSRRFCSDPKCASRTHTAEHRARQRRS